MSSAGCSLITFSPSAAREMWRHHRNKHVTPSLNPFFGPGWLRGERRWRQRSNPAVHCNCVKLDHSRSKNILKPSPQEDIGRKSSSSSSFCVVFLVRSASWRFCDCVQDILLKVSVFWPVTFWKEWGRQRGREERGLTYSESPCPPLRVQNREIVEVEGGRRGEEGRGTRGEVEEQKIKRWGGKKN